MKAPGIFIYSSFSNTVTSIQYDLHMSTRSLIYMISPFNRLDTANNLLGQDIRRILNNIYHRRMSMQESHIHIYFINIEHIYSLTLRSRRGTSGKVGSW